MSASLLALRDATVEFARALATSGASPDQQARVAASAVRGHAVAHAGLVSAEAAAEVAAALRRAADTYERHGVEAQR